MSQLNESNFDDIALSLFRFQATKNLVYQIYLTYLGVTAGSVSAVDQIPFLPISFFKDHDVKTGSWSPEVIFTSSGTTGSVPSKHAVHNIGHYLSHAQRIFESFYGALSDYHFFALLPSYVERGGSSLIAMVNSFIRASQSPFSSFYLRSDDQFISNLSLALKTGKKVMLIGVSFALLDLAEKMEIDLSDCIVMETGGMKGRREELIREELHAILCKRFNLREVHSEYGMSELFSQAYSKARGYFAPGFGMKILVRDINDPFKRLETGKAGALNVIDLANIYSCAFVETQDLGRVSQDGSFEVLGRIDNSDIRGCNLLVG